MTEVKKFAFDQLNPNDACFTRPPKGQKDACEVEAIFHFRGRVTPSDPRVTFRRNPDDVYFLQKAGKGANPDLLEEEGFSNSDPAVQRAINSSVRLHKWIKENYLGKSPSWQSRNSWYFPILDRVRNFIVTGSLLSTDQKQKSENAILLKQIFELPPQKWKYVHKMLDVLFNQNKTITLLSQHPRIQWMIDYLEGFERIDRTLGYMKNDPLKARLMAWVSPCLVYIATGEGNWNQLKKDLDPLALEIIKLEVGQQFRDFFDFFLDMIRPLDGRPYLKEAAEIKKRLSEVMGYLHEAAREGRATLLSLSLNSPASLPFLRSIEFRLIDAAKIGTLAPLVEKESARIGLSERWIKNKDHLSELAFAIIPSLRKIEGPDGGHLQLDYEKLKAGLDKLLADHSLQEKEYAVGALAVIRFLFGKNLEATTIRAWVKDQYVNLNVVLSETEKKQVTLLMKYLEAKTLNTKNRFERSLPWIEGGLCAVGLGLGGAGIGTDQRDLTVSGSTVAGAGCGSFIGHMLVRKGFKKDHWLVDLIGGSVGAGAGFGVSWYLTGRGSRMNPPPPPPPPPVDPRMRNPTGPYGP